MSLRGQILDDPRDQHWIDLVAKYGHAIVKVADRVDEPTDEPGFAYSLGAFETYGAPELIVFGLDNDLAAAIIKDVMDDIEAGRRFSCGVPEIDVVGGDHPVVFLEADPRKAIDYVILADWYYERAPFPVWQLVWPAKNGCFPWAPGFPSGMRRLQPDLTPGADWGGLKA
jgi:hypothetical protein